MSKKTDLEINDTEIIELKNILSTRQWLYDFLGKSFYMEPDIDRFREASKTKIFEQLGEGMEDHNQGIYLLSQFIGNVDNLTKKQIDKLNSEYNRLFIGPGHVHVPPWESVYLSKEKIIFDEHTLAVREFYKRWKVVTTKINKEPDDHIGFELEFMSILINKSIRSLGEGSIDEFKNITIGQKEFLDRHPLVWIDEFSNKLTDNTEEPFYKGIGLFLVEYVKMDRELLEDIISSFDTLL
ncbi:molecular chaperone TorD family protein [Tissierella praeacuta]|uniref:TorD/DmsD family molecular chaperone n=1 Tax=Tissierella praeacuta TaxID=43131 RepID=UPI003342C1FE